MTQVMTKRSYQVTEMHKCLCPAVTLTGGSCMRTHNTEMVPQLDGSISVCSRRRISENMRTAVIHRSEYPGESSDDSHSG